MTDSPASFSSSAAADFFDLPIDRRHAPAWLDEIRGDKALSWVRERNAEAETALDSPIRRDLEERIFEVLTSPDRIPGVTLRGEWAYNFWTDDTHPRGLWRRQPTDAYLTGGEDWDVLIDVDALSAEEGRSLVWHGAGVCYPERDRALIDVSEGGSDADETREFDLETRSWVDANEGGFARATGKGSVQWVDRDLVWMRRDWGPDTVSDSGYPLTARLVERGAEPDDCPELARGAARDLGLFVGVDHSPGFEHSAITFAHDFLNSSTYLVPHPLSRDTRTEDGRTIPANAVRIDAPTDAGIGSWHEWLFITPRTPWQIDGRTYEGGTLLAFDLEDYLAGTRDPQILFAPDAHRALGEMTATRTRLVLTIIEDVIPRLSILIPPAERRGSWSSRPLDIAQARIEAGAGSADNEPPVRIPPLCTVSAGGAAPLEDDRLWLTVSGYTTPSTLLITDLALLDANPSHALVARVVRRAPSLFNADGVETDQHWATSKDGTRVPYFQVGRPVDHPGHNPHAPVLLYGYGGFGHTMTPGYSGVIGRALLSKGGTYVVAGIRGGGEFGPAWHEAARALNKERSYEDFEAVAADLVTRGVATPSRLGIRGGSNGGLLTGNIYARSPELIGAVVIQAPLLDMRRFSHLSTGSSWIAEYGDPDDPSQWEAIRRFSPFHLWDRDRAYPPVLITTSTADDRVHPAHARSFAWMLREGLADVTYVENIEGGHSGAADARDRAHVEALVWAFLWQTLGG